MRSIGKAASANALIEEQKRYFLKAQEVALSRRQLRALNKLLRGVAFTAGGAIKMESADICRSYGYEKAINAMCKKTILETLGYQFGTESRSS